MYVCILFATGACMCMYVFCLQKLLVVYVCIVFTEGACMCMFVFCSLKLRVCVCLYCVY